MSNFLLLRLLVHHFCYTFVVSCVGFSHSKYHIMESDGLLNIILQYTGVPQSFPANVVLIANVSKSDVLFTSAGT